MPRPFRPLLAAFGIACAFNAHADGYRVVDLMPDYWAFHERAQGLDEAAQAALFQRMVAQRHPQVYAPQVIGLNRDKPYDEELSQRYRRVQSRLAGNTEPMRKLSASIAADLPRYEARFRETFPDLAYTGDIYFMHSMGGFDGAVRPVGGKTALLFGVEMIAQVYGENGDPQPFFHRELFRLYHAQFRPPGSALRDALIGGLWDEGLASYAAQTLNPGAAGVAIFGPPPTMPERAQARAPELARALRGLLDSESFDDYARYFLGGPEDATVPPRSGHYIGYLVAAKLASKHPLPELARTPLPRLRPQIERALDELAAGGPP